MGEQQHQPTAQPTLSLQWELNLTEIKFYKVQSSQLANELQWLIMIFWLEILFGSYVKF